MLNREGGQYSTIGVEKHKEENIVFGIQTTGRGRGIELDYGGSDRYFYVPIDSINKIHNLRVLIQ